MGLPAIIGMDLETLFECGAGSLTLEEVLGRGGILRERQAIPRNARLLPVLTAGVVAGLPGEFRLVVKRNLDRRCR